MEIEVSTEAETPDDWALTTDADAATQTVGLVGTDVTKGVDEIGVISNIPNDGRIGPLDGVDVAMEVILAIIWPKTYIQLEATPMVKIEHALDGRLLGKVGIIHKKLG